MIMSLGATKVNVWLQGDTSSMMVLVEHIEIEQDMEMAAIATADNAVINDHDLWDLNSWSNEQLYSEDVADAEIIVEL